MTTQQRYTGPELSALLREVRAELGDQATIHEANRIRTGGIGGFFRREGFEVLASPPPGSSISGDRIGTQPRRQLGRRSGAQPRTAGTGHLALSDSLEADDELIAKLTAAMESEQAWMDAIDAAGSPPPPVIEKRPVRRFGPEDLAPIDDTRLLESPTLQLASDRIAPATMLVEPALAQRLVNNESSFANVLTPGQALLERADDISTRERVGQLLSGARGLIDDSTLTDRTRVGDGTRLTETPPRRAPVPPRGLMDDPNAFARLPGLSLDSRIAPVPTPQVTEPNAATEPKAATEPTGSTPDLDGDRAPAAFWSELARLENMLPIRPTTQASVQLLVGPLDIALPLATRFAGDPTIELSVFTDEVALAGVRDDQLADSSRDLHDRLLERSRANGRGIGVIEADDARREQGESLERMLTPRLLQMIERVCDHGAVHLLRLTLRSLGPIDELAQLVESFPIPCAIDLGTAPSGAELDAALDAQLPIVSIAGRQLTPALAMALKHR